MNHRKNSLATFLLLFALLVSCVDQADSPSNETGPAPFKLISSEYSNIDFNNQLSGKNYKSYFDYINVFNGGGVGAGDLNNDGLTDLIFTGSLVSNRIYINKGSFVFEDISESAGILDTTVWTNGVVIHDVNGDGFEDIYLSNAYYDDERRKNKLYINNGDLTFTEKAEQFGIADMGYSIQSAFFDFDNDGDADLFVANHPRNRLRPDNNRSHYDFWQNPVIKYSDKLYRNEGNGKFTDVTESSGILNYGWSLSFLTSDFNNDGFLDIYVAVDHDEPDRL